MSLRLFRGPMVVPGPEPTLATSLKTLASPTRLRILRALRHPRVLHEIRVVTDDDATGGAGRPISRQAVARHIEMLLDEGLVRTQPEAASGPANVGPAYVLNRERVFALVEEMRSLARLRAVVEPAPDKTIHAGDDERPVLPDPPRIVVSYGAEDGLAWPLLAPDGEWTIGRASNSAIRLDHDPYCSGTHALLERDEERFVLRDLGSKNGTVVNFAPLARGERRPLRSGDLVTLGRTVLVFQA